MILYIFYSYHSIQTINILTLDFKSWDILESAVVEEVMKFKGYWSFLKVLRKGLEPKRLFLSSNIKFRTKLMIPEIFQIKPNQPKNTFARTKGKDLLHRIKKNYSSAVGLIASISKLFFGRTFIPTAPFIHLYNKTLTSLQRRMAFANHSLSITSKHKFKKQEKISHLVVLRGAISVGMDWNIQVRWGIQY